MYTFSMATEDDSTTSRPRKSSRRSAASGIAKRIACEYKIWGTCILIYLKDFLYKKVWFSFNDDTCIHFLPWTELLSLDQVPFENYSDIAEGLRVLAP